MKNKNIILTIIGIFLLCNLASAVSIGGIGKTVDAYRGESREVFVTLQNTAEDSEDITMKGIILDGAEIVSFTRNINKIKIPAGEIIKVPFKLNIPSDATLGTAYPIKLRFETISGGEGDGMISFVINLEKSFKAVVVETPEDYEPPKPISTLTIVLLILSIIVIAIIIWLVLRNRKKPPIKPLKKELTEKTIPPTKTNLVTKKPTKSTTKKALPKTNLKPKKQKNIK